MTPRDRRAMSPRLRTAFQSLTGAVTGLATFSALVATGWYAGRAADTYQEEQAARARAEAKAAAERAAWFAAHPVTRVIPKRRVHRTEFRTVHVPAVSAAPGPGGTITRATGTTRPAGTTTTPRPGSAPAPAPVPAPAPPPPPPPPAPSSGS